MLSSLCTSACNSSLTNLHSQVVSACGSTSFAFGYSGNLTFAQIVEIRQFKYGLTCLQDSSSGAYCLNVEQTWNISALVAANTVQWPNNTYKLYPDFVDDDDGGPAQVFANGTSLPLSWIQPSIQWANANFQNNASVQGNLAGPDYYVTRNQTYSNYGYLLPCIKQNQGSLRRADLRHSWPYALNYDEYPNQIQCSSCFLQKFQYGITSAWGNVYECVLCCLCFASVQHRLIITVQRDNFANMVEYSAELQYDSESYAGKQSHWSSCVSILQTGTKRCRPWLMSAAARVIHHHHT